MEQDNIYVLLFGSDGVQGLLLSWSCMDGWMDGWIRLLYDLFSHCSNTRLQIPFFAQPMLLLISIAR